MSLCIMYIDRYIHTHSHTCAKKVAHGEAGHPGGVRSWPTSGPGAGETWPGPGSSKTRPRGLGDGGFWGVRFWGFGFKAQGLEV